MSEKQLAIELTPMPDASVRYLESVGLHPADKEPQYFAGMYNLSNLANFRWVCQRLYEIHNRFGFESVWTHEIDRAIRFSNTENLVNKLLMLGTVLPPKYWHRIRSRVVEKTVEWKVSPHEI